MHEDVGKKEENLLILKNNPSSLMMCYLSPHNSTCHQGRSLELFSLGGTVSKVLCNLFLCLWYLSN